MSADSKLPKAPSGTAPAVSSQGEIDAFLDRLRSTPGRTDSRRGRLIFAMDATASRQPTWDRACRIQGEMFQATDAVGGLEVQLVFYRGFGECKASGWVASAGDLMRRMTAVQCLGGRTQIARVLAHALKECRSAKVDAMVLVGDCMEEDIDDLCHRAGELGLLGMPVFAFQEGDDPAARTAFQQIARLTGGASCRFDAGSAGQLRELLAAVAVFAAGGRVALADYSRGRGEGVRLLTQQLAGRPGPRSGEG